MISLTHYLALGAVVFCIGLFGVLTRRRAIAVLMGIELMLNGVNINFAAFGRYLNPAGVTGQVFPLFVITVAAGEAAVALALIIALYRSRKEIHLDKITLLKW